MDPVSELIKKIFFRGDNVKYEEMLCTFFGIAGVAGSHWHSRKPIVSNLPLYAVFGIGSWIAGSLLHDWNYARKKDRDLAIWDYVQRHPDQFPETNAKKYKDVLLKWHPIR